MTSEDASSDDGKSELLVDAGSLDVPGAGPDVVLPAVEFMGAGGLTEGLGGLTLVVVDAAGPGT